MILIALTFVIAHVMCEDGSLKKFSDGNVKFTANVYKELLKTNAGNFLVCPMSVQTVFALLHAGTRGTTASQISSGLNLPESSEELKNTFKSLLPILQHTGVYNLSSANKIYIKNQFKVKDEFKTVATETFKSEIQEIDFEKKSYAVNEINKWVEEQTHDKIKNLLTEDDINELTRLVLINAMYFKGNWIHKFEKYNTRKQPFYLSKNKQTDIDTMEITKHFKYHECNKLNVKYLEMDFEGGDMSMTFVLPNDKEGLSAVENNLKEILEEQKYTWEKVHVKIPKYKIETKIQFVPILQKLGIVDAFDGDKADLSGINSNPGEKLSVAKVIQKAFIEVKEEGTTAAAATAVLLIVGSSGMVGPYIPPKEFIADHPFIFILRHKHGVMFVGRYNGN